MTTKRKLKLWLLSQSVNNDYDTYDSCVVAAATENEARQTTPHGASDGTWVDDLSQVTVKEIGVAGSDIAAGVICASFNAG